MEIFKNWIFQKIKKNKLIKPHYKKCQKRKQNIKVLQDQNAILFAEFVFQMRIKIRTPLYLHANALGQCSMSTLTAYKSGQLEMSIEVYPSSLLLSHGRHFIASFVNKGIKTHTTLTTKIINSFKLKSLLQTLLLLNHFSSLNKRIVIMKNKNKCSCSILIILIKSELEEAMILT